MAYAETIKADDVRRMVLPDLRKALRERGLQPGGGVDALKERLSEYCTAVANGETESRAPGPQGSSVPSFQEAAAQPWLNGEAGATNNNYSRSEGQNQGNFMTGRNTSRVLAPPGGASSLSFGDDTAAPSRQRFATPETYVAGSAAAAAAVTAARNNASNVGFGSNAADPGTQANNYARGDGQNVGNFMSGRNSSRVTHAPGGASSIVFGQ